MPQVQRAGPRPRSSRFARRRAPGGRAPQPRRPSVGRALEFAQTVQARRLAPGPDGRASGPHRRQQHQTPLSSRQRMQVESATVPGGHAAPGFLFSGTCVHGRPAFPPATWCTTRCRETTCTSCRGARQAGAVARHAGPAVRVARAVNRAAGRTGRVFADHCLARALKTPAEVRRAVRCVLDNFLHHAPAGADLQTDPCASQALTAPARTWLVSVGWLRSRAGPLPVAYWPH